ncbi:Metallo-dependent hydrolase [Eremomyces bilateralis CBS 781.70]|uniref:Metallo-dependent hydrolase n=1 Tax=Eremomyces bilateralis CBS 781.70 TaxID=1392243 RepID=A0A6G1G636_9PEZI|nr:Metallo-dependent hydrolase [Eremomyces bilateralis CBS 781.70]KAF1813504.1 Metallo-dependent hydrolase [Eremomyces bilateralis CBS 781.70]
MSLADPGEQDARRVTIRTVVYDHGRHNKSFNGCVHIWISASTPSEPSQVHLPYASIGWRCQENGIGMTMHCTETPSDLQIFKEHYKKSPMQFCESEYIAGPRTVLAHMAHLDLDVDLDILRDTETSVSHSLASDLKFSNGTAPVVEMLNKGVNVALGTGAPYNDTYDMFRGMQVTAMLHAGQIRSWGVLMMVTVFGARALRLENDIGSREVGKKADFVAISNKGLHCAPFDATLCFEGGLDPVTVVVHSCTGRDIQRVVVDGKTLVQNGKLVYMDEGRICEAARQAGRGVKNRSGVLSSKHNCCFALEPIPSRC